LTRQIYVDSSPEKGELRWMDKATGEIGRHKIRKGKGVHEAELLAVLRAIEDVVGKPSEKENIELYSDREVLVNQLNHKAGIKDKAILKMADKVWSTVFQAKQERGIEVKFLWVSRKVNPAGKMLGV